MNNKYFYILFLIVLIQLSSAASMTNAVDELEQGVAKIAGSMIIKKLRSETKKHPIDSNVLYKEMIKSPERYSNTVESYNSLKPFARSNIITGYYNNIWEALHILEADLPENVDSWFSEDEILDQASISKEELDDLMKQNYKKSFTKARDKTWRYQRSVIIKDESPDGILFETTDHGILSSNLLNCLAHKIVFEEIHANWDIQYINKVFNDIKSQLKVQNTIVGKYNKSTISSEEIKKQIRIQIQKYQNQLKKNNHSYKIYPLFPSVFRKIDIKANQLAFQPFRKFIKNKKYPVDRHEIKNIITSNLLLHASTRDSWSIITNEYSPEIHNRSINAYINTIPTNAKEEVHTFLINVFPKKNICGAVITDLVKRSLYKDYVSVRKSLCETQHTQLFQPVIKKVWSFPDKEIEHHYSFPKETGMKNFILYEGISDQPFVPAELLDGTMILVSNGMDQIMREGINALNSQTKAVELVSKKVQSEIKHSPEEYKNTNVYVLLHGLVNSIWETNRKNAVWFSNTNNNPVIYPPDIEKKYVDLFPLVTMQISNKAEELTQYINTLLIGNPVITVELFSGKDKVFLQIKHTGSVQTWSLGKDKCNDKKILGKIKKEVIKTFEEWFLNMKNYPDQLKCKAVIRVHDMAVPYGIFWNVKEAVKQTAKKAARPKLVFKIEEIFLIRE